MTNQKKPGENPARIFKMTAKQADLSIASLFYFQSKMPDSSSKENFGHLLLSALSEHAVSGLHRPRHIFNPDKKMPRSMVADSTRYDNYTDKDETCRLSWMLTYAAKLVCADKIDDGANPYKSYFTPFVDYMFTDREQAVTFAMQRPKIVKVEEDAFSFLNVFKRKSKEDKLLDKLAENVGDFLGDDPFADAIRHAGEKTCLRSLQDSIDSFVEKASTTLESYWNAKGMEAPMIPQPVPACKPAA